MRQLVGKIPTKDPDVIQEVYLTETVYCQECRTAAAVPVGIEVVTVKKGGGVQEGSEARILLPRTWF